MLPECIKKVLRPIRYRFMNKYESESGYWQRQLDNEKGTFRNDYFEKIMLAMAIEENRDFLQGKVVADFGCGPRGSLVWAQEAALRIGIDVLADVYADSFRDNILSHEMIYLKSTETVIPLPSDFVDVLFTLNAIDHVDNFPVMCREIIRIIKPGGWFLGSFNLEEPKTPCEPQVLTEAIIKNTLLASLQVHSYRLSVRGPANNLYQPFFSGELSYRPGQVGFLWVKAQKPQRAGR